MEFVVNEWLLDYIRPDESLKNRKKVGIFLGVLVQKKDKMVIRKQDSPFSEKLHRYMGQFGYDTECKKFFKAFKIYSRDSDVTVLIDDTDVKDVPGEVLNKVKSDDRYLIELAYSSLDKTIITTDRDLKQALQGISELKVILLDDFLKEYVTS